MAYQDELPPAPDATPPPPALWSPGDHVLWRFVRHGTVEAARPVTVVRDAPDLSVFWLAPGTPIVRAVLVDGTPIRSVPVRERFAHPWGTRESIWHGPGVLKLVPWGAAHSVWVFWDDDGSLRGWYVNLEAPHRRRPYGVDTSDHVLDIWVTPDRRWEWKDEDELTAAHAAGRFGDEDLVAIRAEGERVIKLIERWASPFRDGWERFRPDPDWALPALPADWATLP
ncbi:DUF402 domain-containing protein [Carbonactinospora thermoautotrophica]|uniref:DUF402 domain-containing protein n=1 Tax=Carbonactinospora thermoautotrophica TaxID=1469144 RepID=UPI0022705F42|nr:DUF402 domain-containing protein [Carbonactinospora thermoautotrophica]